MKKTKQHTNKKTVLIDNLYNYIKNNHEELELKPELFLTTEEEQDFNLIDKENDLELYKKDYSSRIDKQILIISLNIINSLLALNNLKFTAFMSRYSVWGFDLTMLQFINSFYLVVKTDNMLRTFVLEHMDKIINATRNVMEKYLITHMSDFKFRETRTEYNKKKILDKMKKNQKLINDKLKEKDLTVKQDNEILKNESEKESQSITNSSTTTSSPTSTSTFSSSSFTPSSSNILITPFETQLNNVGAETSTTVPRILSMDEIMNMNDEDLQNLDQTAQQNAIPPIENNMENVQVLPLTEEENEPEENEEPEEPEELEENKTLTLMEQLILNNLRQEHPDLLKGFTNNG